MWIKELVSRQFFLNVIVVSQQTKSNHFMTKMQYTTFDEVMKVTAAA